MKIRKLSLSIILGLVFTISCANDDDSDNSSTCDFTTLINSDEYANATPDQLTINSVEITENCLEVSFSSGGCSGDTWELKLIDSDIIMESNPPQRNLIFSLKNEELCEAFITKELSFDISNLQVDGNKVQLNITNSGTEILYEY